MALLEKVLHEKIEQDVLKENQILHRVSAVELKNGVMLTSKTFVHPNSENLPVTCSESSQYLEGLFLSDLSEENIVHPDETGSEPQA